VVTTVLVVSLVMRWNS